MHAKNTYNKNPYYIKFFRLIKTFLTTYECGLDMGNPSMIGQKQWPLKLYYMESRGSVSF